MHNTEDEAGKPDIFFDFLETKFLGNFHYGTYSYQTAQPLKKGRIKELCYIDLSSCFPVFSQETISIQYLYLFYFSWSICSANVLANQFPMATSNIT